MVNKKVIRGVLIGLTTVSISLGLLACSFSGDNTNQSTTGQETTEAPADVTAEVTDAAEETEITETAPISVDSAETGEDEAEISASDAEAGSDENNPADISDVEEKVVEEIYSVILGDEASGDFLEVKSNQYVVNMSGIQIHDLDVFEAQLRQLPKLLYIDMCDCGLTNEQMEELMGLFPTVRFVWRLRMSSTNSVRTLNWSLRTDALAFSTLHAYANDPRLDNDDIQQLKYCTDLIALDFGHNAVYDIDFIKKMPNLHLLITVDNWNRIKNCKFNDLSVLQYTPNMMYLEFFVGGVSDLSFLQYTPQMIDLNISYNPIYDATYLKNLPNIQRLLLESTYISAEDYQELIEMYPDAQVERYGSGSVDNGWRTHKRYRAMIDMFRKDYWNDNFRTPEELEELAKQDLLISDGKRYYGTWYRVEPDSTYSFEVLGESLGAGIIPEEDGEFNFDGDGQLYALDNGEGMVLVHCADDTYRAFFKNEVIAKILNKKLDEEGNVKSEYLLDYDEWFETLGIEFVDLPESAAATE